MATTFELISSVTVGAGGAASIDFTSIPATFTDLCLEASIRTTGDDATSDQLLLTINNSTSSFSSKLLYGTGVATGSTSLARYLAPPSTTSDTSNVFGSLSAYFPNYAGSAYKSYSSDGVSESNDAYAYAIMTAGLWSVVDAITSIKISPSGASLAQYSTAYLYGVKNA